MVHAVTTLLARLRAAMDVLAREMLKFGAVGAVAYVVDVGIFNLLRFGLGAGGPLEHKPLSAKVISVVVAATVAWLGNRYWTFRHRRRAELHHELVLFFFFNACALVIALACLGFSHYVLDLRSALADNISANGVGLVLGTLFRFWAYRRFVFNVELAQDGLAPSPPAAQPPRSPHVDDVTGSERALG